MRGGKFLSLLTVQPFTWSGRWMNLCVAIALEAFHSVCEQRSRESWDRASFLVDLQKAIPYVSLS